jgi:hypothetical protein
MLSHYFSYGSIFLNSGYCWFHRIEKNNKIIELGEITSPAPKNGFQKKFKFQSIDSPEATCCMAKPCRLAKKNSPVDYFYFSGSTKTPISRRTELAGPPRPAPVLRKKQPIKYRPPQLRCGPNRVARSKKWLPKKKEHKNAPVQKK